MDTKLWKLCKWLAGKSLKTRLQLALVISGIPWLLTLIVGKILIWCGISEKVINTFFKAHETIIMISLLVSWGIAFIVALIPYEIIINNYNHKQERLSPKQYPAGKEQIYNFEMFKKYHMPAVGDYVPIITTKRILLARPWMTISSFPFIGGFKSFWFGAPNFLKLIGKKDSENTIEEKVIDKIKANSSYTRDISLFEVREIGIYDKYKCKIILQNGESITISLPWNESEILISHDTYFALQEVKQNLASIAIDA